MSRKERNVRVPQTQAEALAMLRGAAKDLEQVEKREKRQAVFALVFLLAVGFGLGYLVGVFVASGRFP